MKRRCCLAIVFVIFDSLNTSKSRPEVKIPWIFYFVTILYLYQMFLSMSSLARATTKVLIVFFDSNLDFRKHFSSICRASFFQIRQLRQICSSLDRNSAIILANSFVHSKIDYCNSLLFNLPDTSIIRPDNTSSASSEFFVARCLQLH